MRAVILFFLLIVTTTARADDLICERWFFENELTPGAKDCEINCAIKSVGMDTFMCPSQCHDLCSTQIPAFILKRLTYPKGLTKSDKDLIGKHPKDALWVFFSKISAERAATRLFGTNGWNDESDAFRHFMWASLTTLKIGPDKARLFLENHERRPGQSDTERNMDLHNNKQGVSTAVQFQKEKHDGYFLDDTIPAYLLGTRNPGEKKDVWQLVLILNEERTKVIEIKIHKNCCYKED